MKSLRKFHLYLGCFFSPLLILFCLTGASQMLGIRLGMFSDIHIRQYGSLPLTLLSMLMGLSVIVTAILGILMALRLEGSRKPVRLCLALGVIVPVALVLLSDNLGKGAKRKPVPVPPAATQSIP